MIFQTVKTLFLKTERAEEALALLANQLSEHDRSNLLYPYEETIEECSFNDVPCDK